MSSFIERNGIRYAQTTVQIPLELRDLAKAHRISLSETLSMALKERLNRMAALEESND